MGSLIDVHSHVFNGSDLPAEKFIKIVFLDLYPRPGIERLLNTKDEDVVDWLLELFLQILGEDGAPTALEEIEVLSGKRAPRPTAKDLESAAASAVSRIGSFLRQVETPGGVMIRSRRSTERGASLVADALRNAGKAGSRRIGSLSEAEAQAVAKEAYTSRVDIGYYLRWFALFTVYRYVLVDQLAADHERQGYKPLLIAPATIDYSSWLQQEVKSPLPSQVQVMEIITKRATSTAVHPYIAFDPLREVYCRHHKKTFSPLDLVCDAILNHGFVGVKLYPPMGFKPINNSNAWSDYPDFIEKDLGANTRLGDELDSALRDLYTLCIKLQSPILAHAGESNGAGPHFAERADPGYWLPVFSRHGNLKVCLAHFGSFTYKSVAFPSGAPAPTPSAPETSWEWALGSYIGKYPGAPVFADLAFFSEILAADSRTRAVLAKAFQKFAQAFDPNLDHIMFGTDWIMTGIEAGYVNYTHLVVDFLSNDCEFSQAAVNKILVGNATRFLGLGEADASRQRLRDFYKKNGLTDKIA
jgi:predicted TIM-barrel fold metal-dependent hydrolase